MSNPWFRMYSEFMHDPKVQMMSEQDQRRLVMLLCMRCNSDVTLHDKYVTFTLRISEQEWMETKAKFVALGFIDLENNVLNWNKRQFVSDSSAARVAKHRALHKHDDVTQCNVTVTPPEQSRTYTEQNKTEPDKKKTSAEFSLPDWIDKTHWDIWVKARKKMNNDQKQMQVDKLKAWKDEGLDFAGALSNAAANGTQGLFLPQINGKRVIPKQDSFDTKDYGQGVRSL